jgi:dienelactone hydrolase
MHLSNRGVVLMAVVLSGLLASPAAAQDKIAFTSHDGTRIDGWLWQPATPGPHPAVVLLHGCGGPTTPSGKVNSRILDWSERLTAAGYAALAVDSFGPRGIRSTCGKGATRLAPGVRIDDALGALAFLRGQAHVRGDRVAAFGWSAGSQTVLGLVNDGTGKAARLPGGNFRAAVAFYPGCRGFNENPQWRARIPLQIEMGAADDWTPAAPCEALVKRRQAAGDPIAITLHPGAYHDFDAPNLKIQVREGLASSADGTGRAHIGTDPAARAKAIEEVMAFLQHRLKD